MMSALKASDEKERKDKAVVMMSAPKALDEKNYAEGSFHAVSQIGPAPDRCVDCCPLIAEIPEEEFPIPVARSPELLPVYGETLERV